MKSVITDDQISELIKLLDIVNLVPTTIKMPNFWEVSERLEEEFDLKHFGAPFDKADTSQFEGMCENCLIDRFSFDIWDITKRSMFFTKKALEECFALTPAAFVQYIESQAALIINGQDNSDEDLSVEDLLICKKADIYGDFCATRKDLLNTVRYFDILRRSNFTSDNFSRGIYDLGIQRYAELPSISASLKVVGNRIEIQPTGLSKILNGIDGTRIRFCPICSKIFWAKRKDMEACSKQCLNNLRQKKFYERNKEELKEARRQRYQHAKRQKELKEKKDNAAL